MSELLDRMRPVGAPGAPAEGVARRELATIDELADLTAELEELDHEVRDVLDRAEHDASTIAADGERRARALRDELPRRVARATTEPSAPDVERIEDEIARLGRDTAAAVERRRRGVDQHGDELVEAALAIVWRSVEPVDEEGGTG